MAKDGTARGGARVGAGRKPKPLTEKIKDGQPAMVLPEPAEIKGMDMPTVKEYMTAKQKNGKPLCASDVYKSTFEWLKTVRCDRLIPSQLVEQYAMSVARYIQCEEAISEFGMLAKHPTTGNAIASPYVAMSQNYLKQVNQCWYQINSIVKENSSIEHGGTNPQDDLMERLLSVRKGQ